MLLKNNIEKIASVFMDSPTKEFHLRELSRMAGLSTTATKSAIKILGKEGLIIEQKKGLYDIFQANKKSESFREVKKFYTIKKIRDCGLLAFLNKEFKYPEAIILFGSASRGEDEEKSDLDIFILGYEKEIDLKKYEQSLNKEIKLIVMDRKRFENAKIKNPELINNIINGIVLSGYIRVL